MAEMIRETLPRQAEAEANVPAAPQPEGISEEYLTLIEKLRAKEAASKKTD